MKTRWSLIALLFIAAVLPLHAQRGVYSFERSFTSATEVVTLVYGASAGGRAQMQGGTVYCVAACTFTLERGGTGPSTTASTVNEINQGGNASNTTPYHTSNVSGTTSIKTYNVAAGEEKAIDLTSMAMRAGQKITFRTSSATGRIYFQWAEY